VEKKMIQKENTIGEIVAQNFRAAQVFEKLGLDFCCGGKKTISEACEKSGLNAENVVNELNNSLENGKMLETGGSKGPDFNSWELDFLVDYIINTHHIYVMKALPNIFAHAEKVASRHGENHPEVNSIFDLFSNLKEELEAHLQKEEKMLFPYIKSLVNLKKNNVEMQYPPFGTVKNPVNVLEHEHENAGEILGLLKTLSNNYSTPEDACTTYKVLYSELNEFESDLHTHIHLENNILFPKAIKLEKELNQGDPNAVNSEVCTCIK